MKFDLETILKTLGWPLGLVVVFSAVLSLFGVQLDIVLAIAGSMLGAQALIGLLVDVLKWAGVIGDGNAGKWSAALNLVGLAGIAVALGLYPSFDFPKLDAQLVIIAQFGSLIFGYIIQVAGTKHIHRTLVRGFGLAVFSNTRA
jgi:hypothetical protein